MRCSVHSSVEHSKGREQRLESSRTDVTYQAGEGFILTACELQSRGTGERGGDFKSAEITATVVLSRNDMKELLRVVCAKRPELIPGYQDFLKARESLAAGIANMTRKILWVTDARYTGEFKVWLAFNDGTSGEVDLESSLKGPAHEELQDPEDFKTVCFDPEAHTIVWDNGADFAPEFLRDLLTTPIAVAG